MLTKREKAWFFPLCGYQPKINELIFLFSLTSRQVFLLSSVVCQPSGTTLCAVFLSLFPEKQLPNLAACVPLLKNIVYKCTVYLFISVEAV
ncbi:hypothetical protein F3J29_03185 [Enterobacter sp. Cy-643]|nr:hypothetical protein [Enterobacter sp. Cy-643]